MICHRISVPVRHHECDAAGELKLHCLIDRMQDAAAEHASTLNVGMEELAELQLIWVLSRLKVRLDRPFLLGENLEVLTYPSGIQRIFAYRCYDLKINGERAGFAGSFWLPVNLGSGRPLNAKKILPPGIVDIPDVEKFFSDMDKLPECSGDIVAEYRIGAGDIDLNRHLNNAVYARWITDVLGNKFGSMSVRVSDIQLNYLSSGQFGETVAIRAEFPSADEFLISGEKSDGTPVFQAGGKVSVRQ
jgi:acyl-ACP thioesterase